jgi:glycine cleavage system H protein
VIEVNGELADQPQNINDDPYERGWMVKVRTTDSGQVEQLLTAEQYSEQTGE